MDGSLALEVGKDAEWKQEEQLKVENMREAADQSVENQEARQVTAGETDRQWPTQATVRKEADFGKSQLRAQNQQTVVTCSHHPQPSEHFSLPPPESRQTHHDLHVSLLTQVRASSPCWIQDDFQF